MNHTLPYFISTIFTIWIISSCSIKNNTNDDNKKIVKYTVENKDTIIKTSIITRKIADIKVEISQIKNLKNYDNKGYCKAEIRVYKNDKLIDSILYNSIEPVGGHYGLLVYDSLIHNCLIISKFGDYDGSTIIINKNGEKYESIGGIISVDEANGLLFSIYNSDLSGFSIFDLKNFKELIKISDFENRPIEFFKFEDRYFFTAENDETENISIWEIEFDLQRAMAVDIELQDIQDNQLKKLVDYKKTYVQCE